MTFCCIGPPAPCHCCQFFALQKLIFLKIQVVIFRWESTASLLPGRLVHSFLISSFLLDPPISIVHSRQHYKHSMIQSEIQPESRPQKHFSAPLDLRIRKQQWQLENRENITFMIRIAFQKRLKLENSGEFGSENLFSEMVFLLHVRTPSAIWKRALAQSGLPKLDSSKAVENP